jgi:hypothetical protein
VEIVEQRGTHPQADHVAVDGGQEAVLQDRQGAAIALHAGEGQVEVGAVLGQHRLLGLHAVHVRREAIGGDGDLRPAGTAFPEGGPDGEVQVGR